jgi:hypothetical protein
MIGESMGEEEKQFEELRKSIDELKIKIPNLLDIIDEVISHEGRFKSIDEKTSFIITKISELEKVVLSIELNKDTLKKLVDDENNISTALLLSKKILTRNELKLALVEFLKTEEMKKVLGDAFLSKKLEVSSFLWKDFELKIQLYIGKKLLAGSVSVGVIIGSLVAILNFLQKLLLN